MTRVVVILSGCGVFDGSEIHEAVLTLLALDRAGCEVTCAAPNVQQMHVVDHLKGQPSGEQRNVLVESARIARGRIKDLSTLRAAEFDAVVLPGGFGAAKNLCDFAKGGADYSVEPETARFLREMHTARKPIGALCIAPAILAKLLGKEGVALTIGNDAATALRLTLTGARHVDCAIDEVCVDENNRVVTTPCYMYDARIAEIAAGAQKLVEALLRLTR
jgi:enhancing lycopene biosynthesis protein 2